MPNSQAIRTPTASSMNGWKAMVKFFSRRKRIQVLAAMLISFGAGTTACYISWDKFSDPHVAMAAYGCFVWLCVIFVLGGDLYGYVKSAKFQKPIVFEGRLWPDEDQASQEATTSASAPSRPSHEAEGVADSAIAAFLDDTGAPL